ncbi:replication initiation negative regulator SeqA [Arsenophonus sp. aPb]|uniref:replication initiation negative regulator SeqA n=1 Tax=Arsenophonus sp. aPb TaxID=3041619 RepID=UPI00246978EF|nr:replication initiation negative regulator SeqA [Arsenophonus sp. aPb]WGL99193.1 replication initiation negative regulator SeqA [Arsenophonus sp. aPb]
MKTIEVDEELYRYIASHTQHIGENASVILRRLLGFDVSQSHMPLSITVNNIAAEVKKNKSVSSYDAASVMHDLLLSNDYATKSKAIDRFMLILSTLYNLNKPAFVAATEATHGRTRIYFASNKQTLLASGKQTKPRLIPDTPYWVITNTNTNRKRNMIEQIMQDMKFPIELVEKVCGTI